MPWRVSGSGLGWTDIRVIQCEIQRKYACSITISLLDAGGQHATIWRVVCAATWHLLATETDSASVGVHLSWPDGEGRSLEGCVLNLLYRLEDELTVERFRNQADRERLARAHLRHRS